MKTKLSAQGQLTIPKEIRDRNGWAPGCEFEVENRKFEVVLRLASSLPPTSVEDLVGCTDYDGPRRSLPEMEDAIGRGARQDK